MKILVRFPNWLGDMVMAVPFLYALTKEFPHAQIGVLVKQEFAPLISALPVTVDILPFHKRDYPGLRGMRKFSRQFSPYLRPDFFFVLPPSFSSALLAFFFKSRQTVGWKGHGRNILLHRRGRRPSGIHRSQEYLELLSLVTGRPAPSWDLPLKKAVAPYFTQAPSLPYLVVNPNSEAPSRRLPTHLWGEIFQRISGVHWVFIGSAKDRQRVGEVAALLKDPSSFTNLAGKTNLEELMSVLKFSQGVISNDSGPAHLANFLGTPVAVFFGAGDPRNTGPCFPQGKVMIMKADLNCSPCLKNTCPLRTLACLKDLPMEYWADRIRRFFGLKAN